MNNIKETFLLVAPVATACGISNRDIYKVILFFDEMQKYKADVKRVSILLRNELMRIRKLNKEDKC